MVLTDSAKATSGFDLGLERAMASDLDELRWRPLFKSQSWTLWVHDSIDAIWAISVDEFAPIYSWVSSTYWWKDTISLLFWVSGMSPITSERGYLSKRFSRAPTCCAVGRFTSRRVRVPVDVRTLSALTSGRSAGTASLWISSSFTLASWIYTMWPICIMGKRKGEREIEREREREYLAESCYV